MTIHEHIALARQFLAKYNPEMANYVLRDLPETEAAGLSELAWAGDQDGSLHENDVLYLIEKLEAYLDKEERAQNDDTKS